MTSTLGRSGPAGMPRGDDDPAGAARVIGFPLTAPDVTVRIVRFPEWAILRDVRLQALVESPDAFVADHATEVRFWRTRWWWRILYSTWVIARDGDQVIGLACLSRWLPERKAWYVQSVWVRPEYRRWAVGRQMLGELEEVAVGKGASRIQLWVLDGNTAARDAYLKMDWALAKEEPPPAKRYGTSKPIVELRMIKELR